MDADLAAGLAETSDLAQAVTNDRGRMVYANRAFMALAGGRKLRSAETVLAGAGDHDDASDEGETAGARAFRLWTGKDAPTDVMWQALRPDPNDRPAE